MRQLFRFGNEPRLKRGELVEAAGGGDALLAGGR